MSDEPIRWRYGARLRSGKWIWPRGLYELELEKAKIAADRTFPFADIIGVEPLSIEPEIKRWVRRRGERWCLEADRAAVEHAAGTPRPIAPVLVVDNPAPAAIEPRPKPWWDRD